MTQTNKTQATKRPWKLLAGTYYQGLELKLVGNHTDSSYIMTGGENREANARLIVKAVNCHEQLLDAIKASIGWLACGVDKNTQRNLRAITILKEALQRAESEG